MNDTPAPSTEPAGALIAPQALLPSGWAREVLLAWDASGCLVTVRSDEAGALAGKIARAPGALAGKIARAPGAVIPGMPNLHSHAFQRAFSGLTEVRIGADDDFWSWREAMYRIAAAVTPQQLEDIATQLYIEMLRAGYTSVCEFHYLHHDPQGRAYDDPAEMCLRIVAAAERAGIGLTLLPVLYQAGGFGAQAPGLQQRRFINSMEGVLRIIERVRGVGVCAGLAPHSLRAVPAAVLHEAVTALHSRDAKAPIHLHIAEQQGEVDACLAWCGARPLSYLMDQADVDERWCLVHATHADAEELAAVRARGAVIGLCPSTEANLGDGVFPAAGHVAAGGRWGIGSDSQASVDAAEELRWLEYGQRLAVRQRNVLASTQRPQVAECMWLDAVAGGARASARPIAGLMAGQRADFIVLSDEGLLQGLTPAQVLASHLFAPRGGQCIDEVWVGGQRRVHRGRHVLAESAERCFVTARQSLVGSL